VKLNEILIF